MFTYRQWGLVVHTLGKFLRKMYESLTSKFFLILPNHDHHLLGAISLNSKSEPLTVWQTLAGLKFDELNILLIFNRGQFWYSRVLLLLASTSVCLSQACPCDNSSHIKARTTKLGRDAKHIDYDLYCVWGCLALIFLVKFNLKVKIYPVLSYSSVKVKYWRPFSPQSKYKDHHWLKYKDVQTQRKLLGFYRTKDRFWSDFANIKHDYTQEFYQSYSAFISQCPRTGKFHCVWMLTLVQIWFRSFSQNI